jgi:hypothetical protein
LGLFLFNQQNFNHAGVFRVCNNDYFFSHKVFYSVILFQVSNILNDLDSFLKRIEPGVEAITGEERDITSFMRLMRIFNEVQHVICNLFKINLKAIVMKER